MRKIQILKSKLWHRKSNLWLTIISSIRILTWYTMSICFVFIIPNLSLVYLLRHSFCLSKLHTSIVEKVTGLTSYTTNLHVTLKVEESVGQGVECQSVVRFDRRVVLLERLWGSSLQSITVLWSAYYMRCEHFDLKLVRDQRVSQWLLSVVGIFCERPQCLWRVSETKSFTAGCLSVQQLSRYLLQDKITKQLHLLAIFILTKHVVQQRPLVVHWEQYTACKPLISKHPFIILPHLTANPNLLWNMWLQKLHKLQRKGTIVKLQIMKIHS